MSVRAEAKQVLGVALLALSCGSNKKPAPDRIAMATEAAPVVMTRETVARADANADSTNDNRTTGASADAKFNPRLLRRFKPLSERFDVAGKPSSESEIKLGRMLYYDKRLSKSGDLSCNSCHDLSRYGMDGQATSLGASGQRGERNAPSVYDAAGYFVQFWDGRATSVEEQAKGPISNPIEMGSTPEAAVRTLKSISGYSKSFVDAFPGQPDPITFDNIGHAIGAFERGLSTPSRWDKFLLGDSKALAPAEIEGLRVFTNIGCMVCHTGEFLGANSYQRVGAVEPWPNQQDQGRYTVTKNEADRMTFKVPSLRNIEMTGPYFHDGSAHTLEEAVHMMGKYQLGLELSDAEVASVVSWLKSLTGDIPSQYITAPELPKGVTPPGTGG